VVATPSSTRPARCLSVTSNQQRPLMRGALLVSVGNDWTHRLWDVNATPFSSTPHQVGGLVDVVPDLTPDHTVIHVNGKARVRQQAKKLLRLHDQLMGVWTYSRASACSRQ